MKKAIIIIQGVHCASCAGNIERSVSKIAGVKSVKVNVIARKGFVECEDNVKEEDLAEAVKRTGYKVQSITFS